GRVLAFAGGKDLAHDDLRDLLWLDMATAESLGNRDLAELVGRQARQPAAERPDRGPHGARNHAIGHQQISLDGALHHVGSRRECKSGGRPESSRRRSELALTDNHQLIAKRMKVQSAASQQRNSISGCKAIRSSESRARASTPTPRISALLFLQ